MESLPLPITAPRPTRLAQRQFVTALVWLAGLALVLHLNERADDIGFYVAGIAIMAACYPIFWWERSSKGHASSTSFAWWMVLPILRIGLRDPLAGGQLWLPRFGWRTPDDQLVKDVDRALSAPMLLISLAVLPVVAVEYIYAEKLEAEPRLAQLTAVATAVIWWAFTVEFVLMVSITSKKLAYCKQHWLDIIIILLPVVAFLRALRLGRLLRLQSLGKTVRMYKLRGVAMRTYRALLLVDAIARLIHGHPQKRLEKLRRQLADQEAALDQLRADIAALEASLMTESPPQSLRDDLAA